MEASILVEVCIAVDVSTAVEVCTEVDVWTSVEVSTAVEVCTTLDVSTTIEVDVIVSVACSLTGVNVGASDVVSLVDVVSWADVDVRVVRVVVSLDVCVGELSSPRVVVSTATAESITTTVIGLVTVAGSVTVTAALFCVAWTVRPG